MLSTLPNMSKVESSDDSINNLAIPESALKTIKAFASQQNRVTAKMTWSADFIKGKGLGQVILLHGKCTQQRDTDDVTNLSRSIWSGKDVYCRYGELIVQPTDWANCLAEAVAEWLKRPLLSLTVADLGTVETSIEQRLTTWFDLAEAWNAVLLVDEADIFLEQRKNKDLYRNGLVTGNDVSRRISPKA